VHDFLSLPVSGFNSYPAGIVFLLGIYLLKEFLGFWKVYKTEEFIFFILTINKC